MTARQITSKIITCLLLLSGLAFAQDPVQVTPFQLFTFDGNSGNVKACSGCSIYTYVAGTNTPSPTYTDSTLMTPNTNPVLTNSAGYASNSGTVTGIWVGTTCLKLVAKDANSVTLWTQDNVCDQAQVLKALLASASGVGLIGFSQSSTYSAGTVGGRLQTTVNVKDAPYNAACNGSTDDSSAFASAVSAISGSGGTVLVPRGTCKFLASTVTLPANVHIVGSGQGATIINQAGLFPAFTLNNANYASVENLTIESAGDGILLSTSGSMSQPYIGSVSITSTGSAAACIAVNAATDYVYLPTFFNVTCTPATAPNVGTRIGYDLSRGSTGTIGGRIIGGRVENVLKGIYHSKGDTLQVFGLALDGITNGSGGGIGVEAGAVEGDRFFVRTENSAIDTVLQLDPGAYQIQFYSTDLSAISPSQIVDNSTHSITHTICCGDGTGGYVNHFGDPQIFLGNLTMNNGTLFSMPGSINGQWSIGGAAATTAQLGGVSAVGTCAAPNSSFGFPCVSIADSIGRAGWWVSQDYNSTTTGTNMQVLTPPGTNQIPSLLFGANGGTAQPAYVTINTPWKLSPVPYVSLPTCNSSSNGTSRGITDANVTTFNATITGGSGAGAGIAYCNGTNWVFH